MKKITQIITLIIVCAVSSSAFAYDRSHYQEHERKELSPEEKECIDDADAFVRSYNIIAGTCNRVKEKKGSVPSSMEDDLKQADDDYYELKKYLGYRLTVQNIMEKGSIITTVLFPPMGVLGLMGNGAWAASYCDEMYNRELNKDYGLALYPESADPFDASNWVCNTSYKQAKANLTEILNKYRSGMHVCPKD